MADKFRRKREPRHIRLYHSITGCDSWRDLSGNSVKVLIALARFDDGNSNGRLFFSERIAAQETGLARNTVRRCLGELQDHGFIRCTKKGAFNRNGLFAATYRLTWIAWPGGNPAHPTRDFENWKGNSQVQNLSERGSNSDIEQETRAKGGSNSDMQSTETSGLSICEGGSNSAPQVINQRGQGASGETQQRKQAKSISGEFLAELRSATFAHLDSHEVGEQTRLAKAVPIPAGTLSKFINGGTLPQQYRKPLYEAVGIF